MNDRENIIAKIKKCLALSASSNEHEAEAAMRQARKLMEAHNIDGLDIQASEAEERRAKSGAKSSPANWETMLAMKIGDAFGCKVIFYGGSWSRPGEWCFIGCGANPEVSHYAFAVLHRQSRRAREEYIKAKLKRCKVATKTRRADLFSAGWVRSVVGTIATFVGNEQQSSAIDAYMAKNYPSLSNLKSRDRNDGRNLRDHEYDDYAAGDQSGKEAQLNRGVDGADAYLTIGSQL